MKPKPTRGGKREGAGRKATGRSVESRSVTMTPELWAKLDQLTDNRSAWIADRVKRAKFLR